MSNRRFYLKVLGEGEYILPADEFAGTILDYFQMTRGDFERAFHQVSEALSVLWAREASSVDETHVINNGIAYEIVPDPLGVVSILGWISTEEINAVIRSFETGNGKLLPHKDLFGVIIGRNLSGKDLISACLTNPAINKKCNEDGQRLFRERLTIEFGLDFDADSYNYPDARSLYIQMHTLYVEVYDVVSPEYDGEDSDDARTGPLRFIVVLNGVKHVTDRHSPDGVVGNRLDLFVPEYDPDEFPCKEIFMEDFGYSDRDCDGYIVLPFTVKWSDEARTVPLEANHLEHMKDFLMVYGEGDDLKRDDLMERMLEKFTILIEIEDRPHRGGDPVPFVTNRSYYEKNGLSEYYTWFFAIAQ